MFLGGCATTATRIDKTKNVPHDRILAYQIHDETHPCKLTVIRDQGFLGGGCYIYLYIDGTLSTKVDVGEIVSFYLSEGEHLLKVNQDGLGLCALNSSFWIQREIFLKKDEPKVFRLYIGQNGKYDVIRYE
jgi:hypothetical protein